jgi:hypothetical protein
MSYTPHQLAHEKENQPGQTFSAEDQVYFGFSIT